MLWHYVRCVLVCVVFPMGTLACLAEGNSVDGGEVQPRGMGHWSAGVAAFRAGVMARQDATKARRHFAHAADHWERLWWEGEQTPVLARNRARAYYLAGNLPQALVAIHQGLALAPSDRHLRREWFALRAEVADSCDPRLRSTCQPISSGFLRRWCSPWEMWGVVTALWWVGCLALARYAMIRRRRWLAVTAGAFCAAILLAVFWWWEQWQWQRDESRYPRLILARPTLLHMGNAAEYPPRWPIPLPAGVEGRCVGQRGNWLHVWLPDGTRGWIPATHVLWVHPSLRQSQGMDSPIRRECRENRFRRGNPRGQFATTTVGLMRDDHASG
jgi:hypothetical protein